MHAFDRRTDRRTDSFLLARPLHYITLETIYSGLSKNSFEDHYGDAATEQCLSMIAEINDEMLRVMGQTGRRQVDSSRVVGQQQQKSDRRQ